MGNMPDINNGKYTFRLPLTIIAKLRMMAKERMMDLTSLVHFILEKATRDVDLTDEEWDWVKQQTRKNREKRNKSK